MPATMRAKSMAPLLDYCQFVFHEGIATSEQKIEVNLGLT